MSLRHKLHVIQFVIGLFCFGIFTSDATAKVMTLSFYMKGVTQNSVGRPFCGDTPADCIVNLEDHEIYGYFVFNDKNRDGKITLFEWVEYNVSGSWNFGNGFLPADFDPIEDLYDHIFNRLSYLDFRYQDILNEQGKPTGRLTGQGVIRTGSSGFGSYLSLWEDQRLTYSATDGGLNTRWTSGYPPREGEFSRIYPSHTWNTLRSGIHVVSPPPPPVPLPAAAWFFLTALGGLFGLRYFRARSS
ncbi:MAG: hypothetical protein ACTS10_02635 [Kiloniellales bacterium]